MSDFAEDPPYRDNMKAAAMATERRSRPLPADDVAESPEIRNLYELLQARLMFNQETVQQLQDRIGLILDQREDPTAVPISKLPETVTPLGNMLLDLIHRVDRTNMILNDTLGRVKL